MFRISVLMLLFAVMPVACDKSSREIREERDDIQTKVQLTTPTHIPQSNFVGRQACAGCHEKQSQLWRNSHHDLAMQKANVETVLGAFDNRTFTNAGLTSSFYRRDGKFFVKTDDADGELAEFEITYTFGVSPLQQYLIDLPDGRKQALGIAWDDRPVARGGQRWFHLYRENTPKPGDTLHWTGIDQTWNYQCAECHSTQLQKNYNADDNSYATTWSEIDVSCEACHGPGSTHIAWVNNPDKRPGLENAGFKLDLQERQSVNWIIDQNTGNAKRSVPIKQHTEAEICGRCHSRRGILSEDYRYGALLDSHRPALLTEGLYYPDGQIHDEVYVYGSFLQSKMYQHGVTCGDCHEPHSLNLRVSGNGVCLQCHAAQRFDNPQHHFHKPDASGSACVDCHMPAKAYMVVDPRRDHSMRIPRPDLSVTLGVPNACNECHIDETHHWAAKQVEQWYGSERKGLQRYGEIFLAARQGDPKSATKLQRLIQDKQQPAIARATAIRELSQFPSPDAIETIATALRDSNALVRYAAVAALSGIDPSRRIELLLPLLGDALLAVRLEAARALNIVPPSQLNSRQQQHLDRALEEYKDSLLVNADRPEAQVELGVLLINQGQIGAAKAAYQRALELDPGFVPAFVNLADLYAHRGREDKALETLHKGIRRVPDSAALHHALGLSLVRAKRLDEALYSLRKATTVVPTRARYYYVYGVALHSSGKIQQALDVLRMANEKFPFDSEILSALVAFYRDSGDKVMMQRYAGKLAELTDRQNTP